MDYHRTYHNLDLNEFLYNDPNTTKMFRIYDPLEKKNIWAAIRKEQVGDTISASIKFLYSQDN